jgi:hypothetical protein
MHYVACFQQVVPANKRATQGQKGLMDVGTPLKSRAQPAHLMQPGDRAFNHPTLLSQPRTMWRAATGQTRPHMQGTQPASVRLAVIGAVTQHRLRTAVRAPALAAHRRHRLHERAQLCAVVAVGTRDVRGTAARLARQ